VSLSAAAPEATSFDLRPARREDVGAIHAMIGELAEYEKLAHLCVGTAAELDAALFGPRPAAEVLVATAKGEPAGFALYFHTYSTFLARRGLWLEDLFVRPQWRRRGCAQALLRALARIACDRGCGRFEWSVLDWNTPALDFYRSLGAAILPDWRIARVTGEGLTALADGRARPAGGP